MRRVTHRPEQPQHAAECLVPNVAGAGGGTDSDGGHGDCAVNTDDGAHRWTGAALPWTLCFIRRGRQLLLLERRRAPNLGLWSGVGGKLDAGESPRDGVLREVREETGLRLPDARFAGVITWRTDGRAPVGAYAFTASLPDDLAYATPRETDEGVLDWKDAAWVLDERNERVPASARRYLPALLDDPECYEHRFTFAGDSLTAYERLPMLPPRTALGAPPLSDGRETL